MYDVWDKGVGFESASSSTDEEGTRMGRVPPVSPAQVGDSEDQQGEGDEETKAPEVQGPSDDEPQPTMRRVSVALPTTMAQSSQQAHPAPVTEDSLSEGAGTSLEIPTEAPKPAKKAKAKKRKFSKRSESEASSQEGTSVSSGTGKDQKDVGELESGEEAHRDFRDSLWQYLQITRKCAKDLWNKQAVTSIRSTMRKGMGGIHDDKPRVTNRE
ncbi:uncharacterized protein LOC143289312 [Babylonia areolata]|uniref:uncharacterized protein LOC143289312 n=1 Tax=Babylonia areolata TaxID=304850 RepID=UPI003FD48ABB